MLIEKVQINERLDAVIVCPKCGNTQVLNASKCRKHLRRVVARCSCGTTFHVLFAGLSERRNTAFRV